MNNRTTKPAGRAAGRAWRGLALGLLLAGCLPVTRAQPVLDGAVSVAAPTGYCVEPAALVQGADTALVLIGRCTGQPGTPRAQAILTAAVGVAGGSMDIAANGGALGAYFSSNPGRAALSRNGTAESVTVHKALLLGDAFLMHLTDTSPNRDSPAEATSWRAVLSLAGRLVTLNVAGTREFPLENEAGLALLEDFVAAMQAANRSRRG